MSKNKRTLTAAELMSELERDPEFVARQNAREAARLELEHKLKASEVPLLDDLRGVGIAVDSVWDLVNTSTAYGPAIPILLAHLDRDYPPRIREGIVRALSVPEARCVATKALFSAFRNETDENVKWCIGNALAVVADDSITDELVDLAQDSSHGDARQMLLMALRDIKSVRSRDALQQLLKDGQLKYFADGLPKR